jgi:group II intron reverse transcriptase/maturase/CRISPR-associated endonuclease Cas1
MALPLPPVAIRPAHLIQARLVRPYGSQGTATLAQASLDALRQHGRRLAGALAVQVQPVAHRASAARVSWSFHGWPRTEIEAAGYALATGLAARQPQWRVEAMKLLDAPPCAPGLMQATEADLALRFDTPLRFTADAARNGPVRLDAARLLDLLRTRCDALTAQPPRWPDDSHSLGVLSHFGHLEALAGANSGGRRSLQFQGTLLLRDASSELVHTLWDLQFLNLTENRDSDGVAWRGAYRLHRLREPWLDHAVLKRPRLALAAQRLMRENDVVPVLASGGTVMGPVEMTDTLLGRWRAGRTEPQPTEAFDLHRQGHAPRRVERLATLDLLAQQHLLRVLTPAFERLFAPNSYGFRPGRSRLDAIESVRAALRDGFAHVVESDIAQCFPSIDHERLLRLLNDLLPRSDTLTRDLLRQAIRQPSLFDGARQARTHGLAQGAPLSPLLTNLMLTRLDESLDSRRFRYVRYADDFVVLARSRADAQEALATVRRTLGDDGLSLAEHKTRITHVQQGFTFLGESFTRDRIEALPLSVPAQRKPLVVAEPYLQLGANGEALEVRRQGQLVGLWPLRRLSELLILGPAAFSSTLVERCQRLDVPIAVARGGRASISLVGAGNRRFFSQQFAHGLWHAALSDSACLAFAKEVIDAKLHNQAALVGQRRGHAELVGALAETRRQLGDASDLGRARGHEGHAARLYFQWMREQIVPAQRPHFMSARRARGGPDRLNALLNFAYYLLYARISGLTRLMALNPYLGWLHDTEEDYETLVYDLMEPFRPFVDRIVLRLLNRLELRAAHFDDASGAWRLCTEGVRRVVDRFEHGMGEKVQGVPLRELLWAQVRSVRLLCAGEGALWLLRWSPREPLPANDGARVLTLESAGA